MEGLPASYIHVNLNLVLCTRSENKEPGTCTAQLRNRVLCTRSENKEPGTCTAPEPGTVSGAGECQDNISIYELKQTCSLSGADPDAILLQMVFESTFGTRCGSGTGYCIWSRRCRSRCSSGTGYYTYSGTGYCICLLLRLTFPLGELEDLIPIPLWYLP